MQLTVNSIALGRIPEIAEAIQGAKINPAHDHLNALLDESQKQK